MNKIPFLLMLFIASGCASVKNLDSQVNEKEVDRLLRTLSSDEMQGRKTFTPAIDKAADFIAAEFKRIGLKQMDGVSGYKQTFTMYKATTKSLSATINGEKIDSKNVAVISTSENIKVDGTTGYTKAYVKKGGNLGAEINKIANSTDNVILFVDTSFSTRFKRISASSGYMFQKKNNLVLVMVPGEVSSFSIEASQELTTANAQNVVGILPGKSKKDEEVIFSGHYDHIGIGKAVEGDSIYNGANDDASGITAVITIANYFKKAKNNERTLVFVAFTAEEMGGYGSRHFSEKLNPEKVVAMFNLEMIGTESKWGKNSAYITGFSETNMGALLQKNLEGSAFTFHPDPYPQQQLFYRSDNATLARLGVPAHTISTSKMDVEVNYHKVSDEIETLDTNNMAAIIRAIIASSTSIVNGKDTPTRVKVEGLRQR